MTYLLDTDIVIYSIKGSETVALNIENHQKSPLALSVITYGELLFGAHKSKNRDSNLATVYRLREIFPVIPVDNPVIQTFSDIKARSQKTGQIVADFDLLIAATALTFNMTLVTNNTRDFKKVKGLKPIFLDRKVV